MNVTILKALLRLFAIIANVREEGISANARQVLIDYLQEHINEDKMDEYLMLYDYYVDEHHKNRKSQDSHTRKKVSANSVKVLRICHEINEELQQKDKIIVLFRLLEYVNEDGYIDDKELQFIDTVSEIFRVDAKDYKNLWYFIVDGPHQIPGKDDLLIIDGQHSAPESPYIELGSWFEQNRPKSEKTFKHLFYESLQGQIMVLHLESINSFIFRYNGEELLNLNNHLIQPGHTYVLDHGAIIKNPRIQPIYYSDIARKFLKIDQREKVVFTAKNISFQFKNSNNGIRPFNFSEESGQLIGVMGGSGVGKSTLLDLLSGKIKPDQGKITINGYDIHAGSDKLEGFIGFVPQDDLLIEELTVYQNLFFNARLCFRNFTHEQIHETVERILDDLDLTETKNLRVGSPLKKVISGGQRKRLNIALELMREPLVLFADEPTSGLSSMDSENVVLLLKEQTLKGKLVVANIHQPSSDIFKLFDKLLVLDKGGHPIYYGNPINAINYFRHIANYVSPEETVCSTCGNVNPEQILQIVETRVLDAYGRFTNERKVSPQKWYQLFKERIDNHFKPYSNPKKLPQNSFKIPDRIDQFKIFSLRSILSKLTNRQYLLINFLEAPLLAFILAFFTKFIAGTEANPDIYLFSKNENIPGYLFMAVVVFLFVGLTLSAEEIIRDRKLIEREKFLNLSPSSYINSKVTLMLTISAIQSFSFVLVGNLILEIHNLFFEYWLILFSTAAVANIAGLNISAGMNSVVTIYILIPFILVPQLLLSGAVVSFDKLHKSIASDEYTPLVGDLMPSRWAYEALSVVQFKDNSYEKRFFEINKRISNCNFKAAYLIPSLQNRVQTLMTANPPKAKVGDEMKLLANELAELASLPPTSPFFYTDSLRSGHASDSVLAAAESYLKDTRKLFLQRQEEFNREKNKKLKQLIKKIGKDSLLTIKRNHHNKALEQVVRNKFAFKKLEREGNKLVQRKDPIFKYTTNPFGRAHFFAPQKQLFGYKIDTLWFNTAIIWLMALLFYITLRKNTLRNILTYFDQMRFKQEEKHEMKE